MSSFRIPVLVAAVSLMLSCRDESDIRSAFAGAADAARVAQWNAAISGVPIGEAVRDFSFSRSTPAGLLLTDSGIIFNYADGLLCSDGIRRKGKCLVRNSFSANGLNDTCELTAYASDSFAISGDRGWLYFSGKIRVTSLFYYSLKVETEGSFSHTRNHYPVTSRCTVQLDPGGITGRSAMFGQTWTGKQGVEGGELDIQSCIRPIGCSSFFTAGTAVFRTSGPETDIAFDAYGNRACDQVFRISRGRDEILFNLW